MDWLVKFGIDGLETMFVVGGFGTVLVLFLSAIEDVHTITNRSNQD